jgi:peptidoglycan hydrolase-like protein with peptidoglycan-binding domain
MSRSRWVAAGGSASVGATGSGNCGPESFEGERRLRRRHLLVPSPATTRILWAAAVSAIVLALTPTAALASVRRSSPPAPGAAASAATLAPGSGYGRPGGSTQVRSLQRRLERAGYAPGPIDGLYGPLTEGAVDRFQATHDLQVDGIAGRQTWSALIAPSRTLYAGMGFDAHGSPPVRALQRRLRRAGYPPGAIDGRYGPVTENAVKRFQAARGLVVDGVAGPQTLGRLARQAAARPRSHRRTVSHLAPVPAPPPLAAPVGVATTPTGSSALVWILPLCGLGLLLAGAVYVGRRRRTRPAFHLVSPSSDADEWPTAPRGAAVLGYASVRGTTDPTSGWLSEQAEVIARACDERGLELLQVVGERESRNRVAMDRPGLDSALERISRGEAQGLVVAELARLTRSAAELGRILDRLADSDARLVAAAERFDTEEDGARLAAELLIEVSNREPERIDQREGIDAASAPIWTPGASGDSGLAERIVRMRADAPRRQDGGDHGKPG